MQYFGLVKTPKIYVGQNDINTKSTTIEKNLIKQVGLVLLGFVFFVYISK